MGQNFLPQLFSAAESYQKNLLDKNLLIIGQSSKRKEYTYIEAIFRDFHFMHLTGCKTIKNIPAKLFFELCLSRRLRTNQFTAMPETALKLDILASLCNFTIGAKMIGNYNGSGNYLYTERLAGGIGGCMGFVENKGTSFMAPNTVLREDIRKLVTNYFQVVAIYEKPIQEPMYPYRPKYLAKALTIYVDQLRWPEEIMSKITPAPPPPTIWDAPF